MPEPSEFNYARTIFLEQIIKQPGSSIKELYRAIPALEAGDWISSVDYVVDGAKSLMVDGFVEAWLDGKNLSYNEFLEELKKIHDFRDGTFEETFERFGKINFYISPTKAIAVQMEHAINTGVVKKKLSGLIFISYRRDDSADITGRIYDFLVDRYDSNSIFKDVDSIPLGVNFKDFIADKIDRANLILAIIGKNWLGELGDGQRRIDSEKDFVRLEIEYAINSSIDNRIIPIFVGGAKIPEESKLPEPISELSYFSGLDIRPDPDFKNDMERLCDGINSFFNIS